MTVYVYRDGRMVDKATGEPMVSGAWEPCAPMVCPDTPGYESPVTGAWIEGRRARRYDLESNDCVPYEAGMSPTGGKFKNRRFCEKHGLKVTDD